VLRALEGTGSEDLVELGPAFYAQAGEIVELVADNTSRTRKIVQSIVCFS
jgi:hypothetical protein